MNVTVKRVRSDTWRVILDGATGTLFVNFDRVAVYDPSTSLGSIVHANAREERTAIAIALRTRDRISD